MPQVWHSIGPRLASLARFRDPSEGTFALFGNLRHSSGSVFAHLRIPIGHYRDTERQHEALLFLSGQLGPSTIKPSQALEAKTQPLASALDLKLIDSSACEPRINFKSDPQGFI